LFERIISKKALTLKNAYAALDADREKIKAIYPAKGIVPNEMVFLSGGDKDFVHLQ
jgi:hypothetical protein